MADKVTIIETPPKKTETTTTRTETETEVIPEPARVVTERTTTRTVRKD
jgi:hypothetical protein